MPSSRVPSVAYTALAAADTLLAGGPPAWSPVRRLTKPLLMPVLAAGLLGADRNDPAVRRALAGQALSCGGDVALLGSGRGRFLAGLGSFLSAHLAYVAAFRSRSSTPLLATTGSRVALGGGAVLAPAMALAAGRRDPRLAAPVAGYALVIATMAAAAAAVPAEQGGARISTGAALFLLSDTLLGLRTFVLDRDSRGLDAAVMATYTAGQWWIGRGVAAA